MGIVRRESRARNCGTAPGPEGLARRSGCVVRRRWRGACAAPAGWRCAGAVDPGARGGGCGQDAESGDAVIEPETNGAEAGLRQVEQDADVAAAGL